MAFNLTRFSKSFGFQHEGMSEVVIYRKKGRPDRNIRAVVNRPLPGAIQNVAQSLAGAMTVVVVNAQASVEDDGIGGISADELAVNLDRIVMPVRIGGDSSERVVRGIVQQDDGHLHLEVN